jgi:predicted nucleic acid-binding protein
MILDTNVVSELLRSTPDPRLLSWFGLRDWNHVYVTAVTRAELLLGARLLPEGRRRRTLEAAILDLLEGGLFLTGCLPFDLSAADAYASIKAAAVREGRSLEVLDTEIAAIAIVAGMPLVTRNVKDFRGIAGLELLNPWLDD